jgi:Domain of unknown function (DUF4252)
MRLRAILLFLVAMTIVNLCSAQRQAPAQGRDWMPRSIESLRQGASSKTEFTMDHSMLVFAAKMDPDNAELQRVIAGVDGVTVHSYRFPKTWTFDPAAVASMKDEYQAAGWKQLMNRQEKDGGSGVTDLWIRLQNNAISNVAILQAKSNEINFVQVSGSISPLDLSHLGGHFGIPKLEGGVVVPK